MTASIITKEAIRSRAFRQGPLSRPANHAQMSACLDATLDEAVAMVNHWLAQAEAALDNLDVEHARVCMAAVRENERIRDDIRAMWV